MLTLGLEHQYWGTSLVTTTSASDDVEWNDNEIDSDPLLSDNCQLVKVFMEDHTIPTSTVGKYLVSTKIVRIKGWPLRRGAYGCLVNTGMFHSVAPRVEVLEKLCCNLHFARPLPLNEPCGAISTIRGRLVGSRKAAEVSTLSRSFGRRARHRLYEFWTE